MFHRPIIFMMYRMTWVCIKYNALPYVGTGSLS